MLKQIILILSSLIICAHAGEPGEALFREAKELSRKRMNREALSVAEKGAAELERALASGEKIGRWGMDGLSLAARLSREDFLNYDKALGFSQQMFSYADNDYWRIPAWLDMALTYRAMGDFKKAEEEYDAIAAADEKYSVRGLLPHAEMVLYDLRDEERGEKMLREALMTGAIQAWERIHALMRAADRCTSDGNLGKALEWYELIEKMPVEKEPDRLRLQTQGWYETGRIEESLGRVESAKTHYRKAMALDGGDMRFRARARDALESIEYFE